jgi:hypothetical protein
MVMQLFVYNAGSLYPRKKYDPASGFEQLGVLGTIAAHMQIDPDNISVN